MLFLFGGQDVFSQIIIESGSTEANFGVDADVQANESRYIYVGGILQTPPETVGANTDDWFENANIAGNGVGIIDITGGNPVVGPNPAFTVGMAEDPFFIDGNGKMWLDALYLRDPNSAGNNKDFSVFQGNSNKNADNPGTWNIVNSSTPQKNDIIDVFAHLRRDGNTFGDDLYAFVGASTRSGDGSAYLDIEFYREDLVYDPGATDLTNLGPDGGHTAWEFDGSGDVTQLGDAIVSLDFENGGAVINGHIYIWVRPADLPGNSIIAANAILNGNADAKFTFVIGGNGQPIFESGNGTNGFGYAEIELKDQNAPPIAFASINADPVLAGPWQTVTGSQGATSPDYPDFTLVEFGINLSEIGLDQSTVADSECGPLFGGVIVKTRSSASFTSELKDLAGPFPFGNVQEVTVTIDGEDLECNATSVTLTANTNVQFGLEYEWYEWINGAWVLIPNEDGSTLEVSTAGNYKVIVTAPGIGGPGTGCSSEDEYEVIEVIPPVIVVDCPADEEITACLSQAAIDQALSDWFADFTYSGGQGNLDAVYEVGGQVIDINTYTLPTFTPCTGGSITVTLTVTDECEQEETCSSTFSVAGDDEAPTLVGTVPSGQTDMNLCFADIPAG
ncbi:MAG: hypothetical protein WD554_07130, partial [Flavobacteriaceae bacterium]